MELLLLLDQHLDAGVDEERAEDVPDPGEAREEGHAERDHRSPADDRPEDSPEQDPVLELAGHGEEAEDQNEDEDVVDRKRLFDDVTGDELDRLRRSRDLPDPRREEHRERDPDDRPAERLAKRRDVGLAVEDAQVDREDREDEDVEADPESQRAEHPAAILDLLFLGREGRPELVADRAEGRLLGLFPLGELARVVALLAVQQSLPAEADTLARGIHLEDLDLELAADGESLLQIGPPLRAALAGRHQARAAGREEDEDPVALVTLDLSLDAGAARDVH